MQDNTFIDTSVLVYAFDDREPKKHRVVSKLISETKEGETVGFVSAQVLCELYNVLTRFLSKPLSVGDASEIVSKFFDADEWVKLHYSTLAAKRAVTTAAQCRIRIWDALIAETMKENGLSTIVTENEKDFKKVPGIRVINPFRGEHFEENKSNR